MPDLVEGSNYVYTTIREPRGVLLRRGRIGDDGGARWQASRCAPNPLA